jgi:ATP-binding cassette, subfamily D (ALD), member 3
MIAYFMLCSALLRTVQPPFGELAAQEQKLEGEYRLRHSRLIAHAEEVAFYSGGSYEQRHINLAFDHCKAHACKIFGARWRIGIFDAGESLVEHSLVEFLLRTLASERERARRLLLSCVFHLLVLVKYLATIVGYSVVSIPIFFSDAKFLRLLLPKLIGKSAAADRVRRGKVVQGEVESASDIAGQYTRNSRLLLQLASAIGRLVLAGKEVNRLTGFTQRVANLRDVLDDMAQSNAVQRRFESSPDLQRDIELARLMKPGKLVVMSEDDGPEANIIRFVGVNLISPDSVPLATNLTFEIPRGCHVLLTGPNGVSVETLYLLENFQMLH